MIDMSPLSDDTVVLSDANVPGDYTSGVEIPSTAFIGGMMGGGFGAIGGWGRAFGEVLINGVLVFDRVPPRAPRIFNNRSRTLIVKPNIRIGIVVDRPRTMQ